MLLYFTIVLHYTYTYIICVCIFNIVVILVRMLYVMFIAIY